MSAKSSAGSGARTKPSRPSASDRKPVRFRGHPLRPRVIGWVGLASLLLFLGVVELGGAMGVIPESKLPRPTTFFANLWSKTVPGPQVIEATRQTIAPPEACALTQTQALDGSIRTRLADRDACAAALAQTVPLLDPGALAPCRWSARAEMTAPEQCATAIGQLPTQMREDLPACGLNGGVLSNPQLCAVTILQLPALRDREDLAACRPSDRPSMQAPEICAATVAGLLRPTQDLLGADCALSGPASLVDPVACAARVEEAFDLSPGWYTDCALDSDGGLARANGCAEGLQTPTALDEWVLTVSIWPHLGASLMRLVSGWGIGLALGVAAGIASGLFTLPRSIVLPFTAAIFPVPKVVIYPILALWLGGFKADAPLIATVAAGTFFVVVIATYGGVDNVNRGLVRMGQSFGLTRRSIIAKIVLPAALPAILSGARTSISLAIVLLIAAELFSSVDYSLGGEVARVKSLNRSVDLLAYVVVMSLLGMAFYALLGRLERYLLRWR